MIFWREVPIPFGVSVLPNGYVWANENMDSRSNPLWGFCSSKLKNEFKSETKRMFQSPLGFLFFQTEEEKTEEVSEESFNPLWGFCSSKRSNGVYWSGSYKVSIPFGVSVLPNSISAIPVFMRAKLVVCGEESFFSSFSTEFSLKMSLSPVFMRCAVKFIFSFIAFIYYNGNFL